MKKDQIIIYTDGSSLGNPGAGGWGGVLLFPDGKVKELGGREKESTNNRMEMTAIIEALKYIENLPAGKVGNKIAGKSILVHTDSMYVLNGITLWIYSWIKNDWKTKTKEDVLNKDLWETLYKVESNLKHKYEIEWVKVAGHSGVHLNERCDEIATGYSGETRPMLFTGNIKDYEKMFGEHKEDHTKPTHKKNSSKAKAYSYVSEVGGKVFADKTWAACERRVKGRSGAKYKKVFSEAEETELVGLWSLKSLF